jgi:hypothetical protein
LLQSSEPRIDTNNRLPSEVDGQRTLGVPASIPDRDDDGRGRMELDTVYMTGPPARSHLLITNTCPDYSSASVIEATGTGLRTRVTGTTG